MENNWSSVLFGAQLVDMNDEHLIVKKNGKTYVIDFELDQGGCICSYARLKQQLFFEPNNERNPIITNIKQDIVATGDYDDCAETKITLFGEYKPLAVISCACGSGSGWQYGAAVTLVCKSLNINDVICSW